MSRYHLIDTYTGAVVREQRSLCASRTYRSKKLSPLQRFVRTQVGELTMAVLAGVFIGATML